MTYQLDTSTATRIHRVYFGRAAKGYLDLIADLLVTWIHGVTDPSRGVALIWINAIEHIRKSLPMA